MKFHQYFNEVKVGDLKLPPFDMTKSDYQSDSDNSRFQQRESELARQNSILETQLAQRTRELQELQSQYSNIELEKNLSNQKIAENYKQFQERNNYLETQLAQKTQEARNLKSKLSSIEFENNLSNQKIVEDNVEYQKRNNYLETQLAQKAQEVQNLQSQLSNIEFEKNQSSQKIVEDYEQFQERNNFLEAQLESQNLELERLRKQLKDMDAKQRIELAKQKEELTKIQTKSAVENQRIKDIEVLDSKDLQNLEIIEDIGYGSGGRVIKVSMKKTYALKQMNIEKSNFGNLQKFIGEYEIMNMLQHPNILKTHGIFFSDEENPPSILLEYCPMNLEQAIRNKLLTKVQISIAIYQIAEGMKYIHSRRIIHRDLKPSNILISEDGTIKICDFGISKLMSAEEQSITRGLGTQKYMAPEIINEENYNEKVDVYSFGVLVYFMISGGELPDAKIKDICVGKIPDIPSSFSSLSGQLIEACWLFEPTYRPSFEIICETLEENNFQFFEFNERETREVHNAITKLKSQIPTY